MRSPKTGQRLKADLDSLTLYYTTSLETSRYSASFFCSIRLLP